MASTREAILRAAVHHFAEYGFSGASLREIMRDAGVNPASAHYHFGSKEAVYRETVGRYLTRLCDERLASLEALEPQMSGATPRQRIDLLVRAYIRPHLRLCADREARDYVRLLARFSTESDRVVDSIYTEFLATVRSRFMQAFAAAAPQVPVDVMPRLFSFMVSLMVTAPADTSYESITGGSAWPAEPEQLIDQISAFVTAGVLAAKHGNQAAQQAKRVTRNKSIRSAAAPPAARTTRSKPNRRSRRDG